MYVVQSVVGSTLRSSDRRTEGPTRTKLYTLKTNNNNKVQLLYLIINDKIIIVNMSRI